MKPTYLDNAATSHPKPESVYQAVEDALRNGGSSGRGSHQFAQSSDRLLFETRELLAEMFNAPDSDRFIFTANATVAINQALFGLLKPGDRVVTTTLEHNAVARPLRALQDLGVEVVKVAADCRSAIVDPAAIQQSCLVKPTRMVVINHCSNVIGSVQALDQIGPWCQERGILFMVDGSQSAGFLPIDFQAFAIDIFAAPGHKCLLGPQGTGFLYVAEGVDLRPLIMGGTGSNSRSDLQPDLLPERFESGTLNIPGIAGLRAGLLYLQQQGIDQLRERYRKLVKRLIEGLNALDGVIIYGLPLSAQHGEVVSFNIAGHDPAEVGFFLDNKKHIAVRVGLHCAPDAHRTIGTFPQGTVRVSPGHFTSTADIDLLIQAVAEFCQRS